MWSVQLSVAAQQSLQTLPDDNREAVFATIGRLTEGPFPPGSPRPYRLRDDPDTLVLRSGRFLIAYTAVDRNEAITIVDIVSKARPSDVPNASLAT